MEKGKQTYFNLHEVIDIVNTMCNLQVSGVDSAIPFLRGAPGGGKTESVRHMAESNGDMFLSCHFALKQPEDLGGIPQFNTCQINGNEYLSTKWSIPELLETLLTMSEEAKQRNKKVIFFLDDIHRCGPFHVTALFELLSERKLREIRIPENVAIVLAGNGSIKAGAQLTNSAIINRCCVLDVETNFEYWVENYALKNNFNLYLLSFLQNQQYQKWFHDEEDITNPWPSPRSWSKLSNILNIMLDTKAKISPKKIEYICRAHVGQDATNDFITYYQLIAKFKIDDLFKKINKSLHKNSLNETVDQIIKKIQEYDDLYQFALVHAFNIEFTQKTPKERKQENYYDIFCACMVALVKNPKNMFPEIVISILKQLMNFILKSDKEIELVKTTYNNMAKEVGVASIQEMLSNYIEKINSKE